jgi:hypothetical protein
MDPMPVGDQRFQVTEDQRRRVAEAYAEAERADSERWKYAK